MIDITLADPVELKKNKHRGSFPATYSLLPLAMSTCDEVGSNVYVLIKELAIGRVENRSEIHSDESRRVMKETKVARLLQRFSFVLQQALSFRTRHHLCRLGMTLAVTRQLRSQGPVLVQAYCTVPRSELVKGTVRSQQERGRGWDGDGNGHGDGKGKGSTRRRRERRRDRERKRGQQRRRERGREWEQGWERKRGQERERERT